jgi:tetratricopeptide (TPR) repeat protein
MKHVPTVMLSLSFIVIIVMCAYFGYSLFVNSNTQLMFESPEEISKKIQSEQEKNTKAAKVYTGRELWLAKVLIETTPEITNIDEILQKYKVAQKENPLDTETIYALGYYNLIKGNAVESKRYFDEVLRLNPKHKEALLGKAYVYLYTKNIDDSERVLETAETLYPEDPDILIAKAEFYKEINEKKLAGDYYSRALSKEPANVYLKKAISELR